VNSEHLKTPDGQIAVVVGGSTPADHYGWMWDLTVPGNNDHDFYVAADQTFVLVHNTGGCMDAARGLVREFKANPPGGAVRASRSVAGATWEVNGVAGQGVTVSGEATRAGTLPMPANPIFTATRGFDAEQKMLEYIAQGLPLDSTGTVNLHIVPGSTVEPDMPICLSCQGVISQFQQRFPGIVLNYTTG
jgi:hypothetical protein